MIYLGSDWHLDHKNIIRFSNRPFVDNREMYDSCLNCLRETLTDKDTLIYAGDLWLNTPERVAEFVNSFTVGKFIFVEGNHDHHTIEAQRRYDLFDLVCQRYESSWERTHYVIDHYPIASWNKAIHGSVHFYGHIHSKPENKFGIGKSMDIGFDAQQKWLIPLPEAIAMVADRGNPEAVRCSRNS